MTATATITPKYVNQPLPGKKLGSIKDQQDVKWFVDPGLLGSFHQGTAITVEWEPMKFSDGKESKKITGVVHGAAPQAAHAVNGAAPSEHPNRERDIFITGVVGRAMGSGKFGGEDLPALVRCALAAWAVVQDKPPVPPDAGLNDEVPF